MVIGQHGSWNRAELSGYKLIFVPFANGKPGGPPRDILTDFLSQDDEPPMAARSALRSGRTRHPC